MNYALKTSSSGSPIINCELRIVDWCVLDCRRDVILLAHADLLRKLCGVLHDIVDDVLLGVAAYVAGGVVKELEHALHVALVDKPREVLAELCLLHGLVVELWHVQVVDIVLAHHAGGIGQEALRFLALIVGNIFAPHLQARDVAHVGQAHEFDEIVVEIVGLAAVVKVAQRLHHIAVGRRHEGNRLGHVHTLSAGKVLGDLLRRGLAQLYALRARVYGGQDVLHVVGREQEDAVVVGFLDELEQLVGASRVHLVGLPHHQHLVFRGVGAQAHLAHDVVALAGINQWLGVRVAYYR